MIATLLAFTALWPGMNLAAFHRVMAGKPSLLALLAQSTISG